MFRAQRSPTATAVNFSAMGVRVEFVGQARDAEARSGFFPGQARSSSPAFAAFSSLFRQTGVRSSKNFLVRQPLTNHEPARPR
jgi:hypothetical protein